MVWFVLILSSSLGRAAACRRRAAALRNLHRRCNVYHCRTLLPLLPPLLSLRFLLRPRGGSRLETSAGAQGEACEEHSLRVEYDGGAHRGPR